MTHFDFLTVIFVDFLHRNQPVLTDSNISPIYRAIREDYAMFLKQATLHLSCVAPVPDARASMKSSPLYRSGHSLLVHWAEFIESTNELENDGLQPYVNRISDSFHSILDSISVLGSELPVIRFKTDVPIVALQNFQNMIRNFRAAIYDMILTPKTRFEGFEEAAFKHDITELMHVVTDLFNRALLHSGISRVKAESARASMTASLAAIAMSVSMAQQFDESFAILRRQIWRLNDRLTRLFDLLAIPVEVALVLKEDARHKKRNSPRGVGRATSPEGHPECSLSVEQESP
jgi:hypothetical protein